MNQVAGGTKGGKREESHKRTESKLVATGKWVEEDGRTRRGDESTRLDEIEKVLCRRADKNFFCLYLAPLFFIFRSSGLSLRRLRVSSSAASCCALYRPIGYQTAVRYERQKKSRNESASLAGTRCRRSRSNFLPTPITDPLWAFQTCRYNGRVKGGAR